MTISIIMAEGGGPPEPKVQKSQVSSDLKKELKKGDTWYLVDAKWFKQWKKYVGYDSWDMYGMGDQATFPGPIDNAALYKEPQTPDCRHLKEHLIDELDYMLLPTEAWDKLVSWYGMVNGQQPIARKVVEHGMFVKHCKVEVYLMELKLCQNDNLDNCVSQQFSKADTIDYIEKEMRKLFEIGDDKETRVWNKYMSNTYEHLNKPENTVQDAGLYQGQILVIEQQNEDGTWPRGNVTNKSSSSARNMEMGTYSAPATRSGEDSEENENDAGSSNEPTPTIGTPKSSPYINKLLSSQCSSYSSTYDYSSERGRGQVQPGLCGLSNLGNTCFMNSALQCLSNVPVLTRYFLENHYQEELNSDNPLGMKGEIAKTYAELIKQIWSGKYSYTIPRNFKTAVGRFAPQFSGYQQQDSHELLAFLLDGLHEDLNRIRKKPYVELRDADGRPDEEVADEAWKNHRLRNDSIIVDTFHGLFKSTLVCPECSKISITFDPFCYLSLPLPIKKERFIEVVLIRMDPAAKPMQYKLSVPKMGTVQDLCEALSRLTKISPDKMVVTDVYNHRFHKVFAPDEGLSHILDRDDIYVYEVPVNTCDDPDTLILPVYMRERKVRQNPSYNYNNVSTVLFGTPLLVPIPRKNTTYEDLYRIMLQKMSRYIQEPESGDEWYGEEIKNCVKDGVIGDDDMKNDNIDGEAESEEDSQGNDSLMNDNSMSDDEVNCDNRMFTFHLVNSYGSAEIEHIRDDDRPIKFTNRSYLALDWDPKAKEKYYDEKQAEELDVDETVNATPMRKRQVISLKDCIQLFLVKEKLGADDPWYCPSCKKHQQATKKFDLWSLPKILVIHLKRFSYNRYWRDKLDTMVEFPTRDLDMSEFIINDGHGYATYDLIGVSNHYGGMGGGHYTAYGKSREDTQWYYFDDSSVSPASEDQCVSKAAYVLFYELKGSRCERSEKQTAQANRKSAAASQSSANCTEDNGTASSGEDDSMEIN
ncbi:ubiquitin carboxyl-terminal hydrolase 15-like isoform X2 [Branchiostoma floridae]|uniref:Ubiquitin carboxyl-terminal hydrolase n=1 Tax=Branchiostoma floridae TaxID=7739 RepID=A0A9J7HWY3_BRAFL|nr:ubiquitin carboxyl-terminal hydrolase 15-like isoform X2 [Branchiostoma floridae]